MSLENHSSPTKLQVLKIEFHFQTFKHFLLFLFYLLAKLKVSCIKGPIIIINIGQ